MLRFHHGNINMLQNASSAETMAIRKRTEISGKKRIFLTGDIFLKGTSMARIKLYHSASREM
jgi:hypothetical protein